jgi:hypothetical protein
MTSEMVNQDGTVDQQLFRSAFDGLTQSQRLRRGVSEISAIAPKSETGEIGRGRRIGGESRYFNGLSIGEIEAGLQHNDTVFYRSSVGHMNHYVSDPAQRVYRRDLFRAPDALPGGMSTCLWGAAKRWGDDDALMRVVCH